VYYTGTELAAALAPLAYGVFADHLGLSLMFLLMASVTLLVIPLTLPIRRQLLG
jgi:hypothetical protein